MVVTIMERFRRRASRVGLASRGEELVNGAKGIKVSRGAFAYPDNDWQKHPVIWYHKVR